MLGFWEQRTVGANMGGKPIEIGRTYLSQEFD